LHDLVVHRRLDLQWASLVHEKLPVIASFAYSQQSLRYRFRGEWKFKKIAQHIQLHA
jgi:hypothetical protein